MPIERVPVVHKFGIVSHAQRLELQERLFQKSQANRTRKPTTVRCGSLCLQVVRAADNCRRKGKLLASLRALH